MSSKKETEILEGFLSGNSKVLTAFYFTNFPKIENYILKNSGSSSEAKDIFQDALVLTYQKLKSGNLNLECSLATYIFAVSRNMWMNSLRKKQKIVTLEPNVDIPNHIEKDIITEIEKQERLKIYHKYFFTLSDECQKLLSFFFSGKKMAEIGSIMGYSLLYTRKKKFECKKKLIELLEQDPIFVELKEDETISNSK